MTQQWNQQGFGGAGQMPTTGTLELPDLSQAKVGNRGGVPFEANQTYIVRVTAVKLAQTFYGPRFIVESEILGATESNARGSIRTWSRTAEKSQRPGDAASYAQNDIKEWICHFIESKFSDTNPRQNTDPDFWRQLTNYIVPRDGESPAVDSTWKIRTWEKQRKNPVPGVPNAILICDWAAIDSSTVATEVSELEALVYSPSPTQTPVPQAQSILDKLRGE